MKTRTKPSSKLQYEEYICSPFFFLLTNRICGLSLFTDLQKYSFPPSLRLHSQYLNFIWLLIIILKHKQSALYLKHLPKTPTCYLSVYQNYINKVVSLNNNLNKKQYFLVHMSQRLRWAFLIKICQLSVVTIELNFYRFYFLLQNHWANFNQPWHKASISWKMGIEVCSYEGLLSFLRGDNSKNTS